MRGLITIVIPVYNHEEVLEQALDSIKKQTYQNFEVIIIDDGSSPPVDEDRYKNIFKNDFKFIRQKNSGAPVARNVGLREARGEYVIFWDADVLASPKMLEKMHNVLKIHREVDYVYANFYFGKKRMLAKKFEEKSLKENNYIHTTSLIRREKCIFWDETLSRFQDWDMWLTMLEQGTIGIYIPEDLFEVVPRSGGMSTWLPTFAYKFPFRALPWVKQRVKEYELAKQVVVDKHSLPGNTLQY